MEENIKRNIAIGDEVIEITFMPPRELESIVGVVLEEKADSILIYGYLPKIKPLQFNAYSISRPSIVNINTVRPNPNVRSILLRNKNAIFEYNAIARKVEFARSEIDKLLTRGDIEDYNDIRDMNMDVQLMLQEMNIISEAILKRVNLLSQLLYS